MSGLDLECREVGLCNTYTYLGPFNPEYARHREYGIRSHSSLVALLKYLLSCIWLPTEIVSVQIKGVWHYFDKASLIDVEQRLYNLEISTGKTQRDHDDIKVFKDVYKNANVVARIQMLCSRFHELPYVHTFKLNSNELVTEEANSGSRLPGDNSKFSNQPPLDLFAQYMHLKCTVHLQKLYPMKRPTDKQRTPHIDVKKLFEALKQYDPDKVTSGNWHTFAYEARKNENTQNLFLKIPFHLWVKANALLNSGKISIMQDSSADSKIAHSESSKVQSASERDERTIFLEEEQSSNEIVPEPESLIPEPIEMQDPEESESEELISREGQPEIEIEGENNIEGQPGIEIEGGEPGVPEAPGL